MNKKLLKSLVCLILVLSVCTGCELGSYRDNPAGTNVTQGSPSSGTDVTDPKVDPPAPENTPYTVTLYYNLQQYVLPEGEEISVIWNGEEGTTVVALEADGTADAGVLDGDYDVTLSGLPDGLSYDPNAYHVSYENRHVDIILVDISKPTKGDGGISAKPNIAMYEDGGCYIVNLEGTYRVTFTEADQTFFFQYTPTRSGTYSISSWCDIYENVVNPALDIYKGSRAYKVYDRTISSGGAFLKDGFTKNFSYEFSVEEKDLGESVSFAIRAETLTNEYPFTIDFAISRDGDYNPDNSTIVVEPGERFTSIPALKDSEKQYNYADLGTKTFDGKYYRLDKETSRYRVYDEERYADNDGWGPYLVCDIKQMPECYTVTSLYDADKAGGSANNFLRLSIWSDEEGRYIRYDYTAFIKDYYATKCNSDGRCYVTEELKEFLQLFAVVHNLWTDGYAPTIGSPEENKYIATEENLWLFACGFYENGR